MGIIAKFKKALAVAVLTSAKKTMDENRDKARITRARPTQKN